MRYTCQLLGFCTLPRLSKTQEFVQGPRFRVFHYDIDISIATISRVLFSKTFVQFKENLEYEFQMSDFKMVNKLMRNVKNMHYKWLADHIIEVGRN